MDVYEAEFDQDWSKFFEALDESVKDRVARKIRKILNYPNKRHLKKISFFCRRGRTI